MSLQSPDIELVLTLSRYIVEFREDLGAVAKVGRTLHLTPYGSGMFGFTFAEDRAVLGVPSIPSVVNSRRTLFDIFADCRLGRISVIPDKPGVYLCFRPTNADNDRYYSIWLDCRERRGKLLAELGKVTLLPMINGAFDPRLDDRRIKSAVQVQDHAFWEK